MRNGEAMQRLYRLVERCARLPQGSPIAHELVTDVIEDALIGEAAPCDLERDLALQLAAHVVRRAHRWRKGNRPRRADEERPASRRPAPVFVPLDQAPPSALATEAPVLGLDDEEPGLDPAEVVSRIRELATGDEPVLRLLALCQRGRIRRREALRSGMSAWTYRAAHDRLMAYAAIATSHPPTLDSSDASTIPSLEAPAVTPQAARIQRTIARALGRTARPGGE